MRPGKLLLLGQYLLVRSFDFPECYILTIVPPSTAVQVFHAGTKTGDKKEILTAGGRVLVVSAYAADLKQALTLAYEAIESIEFEGKTFRRDIAHRFVLNSHLLISQQSVL